MRFGGLTDAHLHGEQKASLIHSSADHLQFTRHATGGLFIDIHHVYGTLLYSESDLYLLLTLTFGVRCHSFSASPRSFHR
jgi:hypothetical protein